MVIYILYRLFKLSLKKIWLLFKLEYNAYVLKYYKLTNWLWMTL